MMEVCIIWLIKFILFYYNCYNYNILYFIKIHVLNILYLLILKFSKYLIFYIIIKYYF